MGVSDEEFRAALSGTRNYAVVMLVDGPNRDHPDAARIVTEHAKRNFDLHRDGVMNVVGPMRSDNRVRGIAILNTTLDEAARILDGDPAIEAGIFTYEMHEMMTFPGSTLAD